LSKSKKFKFALENWNAWNEHMAIKQVFNFETKTSLTETVSFKASVDHVDQSIWRAALLLHISIGMHCK
jgi:hypothetical protein